MVNIWKDISNPTLINSKITALNLPNIWKDIFNPTLIIIKITRLNFGMCLKVSDNLINGMITFNSGIAIETLRLQNVGLISLTRKF